MSNVPENLKYTESHEWARLEDDGSVIIRDAWGSEINMRGGNIIISCVLVFIVIISIFSFVFLLIDIFIIDVFVVVFKYFIR